LKIIAKGNLTAESSVFQLNRCLLCSFCRTFNILPVHLDQRQT